MATEKSEKFKSEDEVLKLIQSLVSTDKLVVGSEQVLKHLRKGAIKQIVLASNCPLQKKQDVLHHAKLMQIPVVELKHNNEELGVICKKNYFVAMLGIRE